MPLPPIVAWNYPTPAALARYLAEQSLGIGEKPESVSTAAPTTYGAATGGSTTVPLTGTDDAELAALLAEVENLSDEEAARLLADEQRESCRCCESWGSGWWHSARWAGAF